ncbi:MAG: RNB domain-containing ribonuclease [Bacteroidales bacterium]|nr:RNB domain-containing ribonuclease [Bacteroidales bacterium]
MSRNRNQSRRKNFSGKKNASDNPTADSGLLEKGFRPKSNSRGIRKKGKPKILKEVDGTVSMTRSGFAFIIVPECEDDIFVPAKKMRGALNGDTVHVAITKNKDEGHSMEGEIVSVLERSSSPYVGILQIMGDKAWVIIESNKMPYDVSVSMDQVKPEYQGQKVAVYVEGWPKGTEAPQGKLLDVLGKPGENNTEMHAILAQYCLPYKFDDKVEKAAASIPVAITEQDIKERRDFRNICTFTVDPSDAKDFDDALSYRKLDNGNYEVGIHIADVSHYVHPGDILDKEAVERGTSVYLVDRTVPMLPEVLSNNLCSLRPEEDKLTFSAVFELDDKANVLGKWFGRTIIRSDRRFAYEQVQYMLRDAGLADFAVTEEELDKVKEDMVKANRESLDALDEKARKIAESKSEIKPASDKVVKEAVIQLYKLSSILRKRRFGNGAISFERPEMKVIVDKEGRPIDVKQKISREANWLIEDFMLLANRGVATFVTKEMKQKSPTFVYRVHDEPDVDKIENLRQFVKHFGYTMGPTKNGRQTAFELNGLLSKVKEKPECGAIEILALRSMARAHYSTDNVGHYGLGFDFYTHFTSPIRRYPDTMVHRLLAHYLENGKSVNKQKYEDLCKRCSDREQVATEAERSSIKYKMAEFMQDKVGQIFDGTISSVTEWGIYVEIEPTKVEGMVMLRDIQEDYFEFDKDNYCVTGKSTHQVFTLGDKVKIKVARTNLEQKIIDFTLVWDDSYNAPSSKNAGRGKISDRKTTRGRSKRK